MKKIYCIILILLISITTYAQRTCGSMSHLQDQIADDAGVAVQRALIEQHTQDYIASNKKKRTLVTIPVVFHVVYNSPADNIADAFILAQLSQLNADYAKLNQDTSNIPLAFKALAANTDIQFCLAVRDPQGQPTTGITRTSTTVTSFSTNNNIKSAATGGVNAWPTTDYLNVWIGDLGASLLGYAQFPGGAANTDGVVVTNTSVGSINIPNPLGGNYDLGRTLTHEVGHWLNLYHVWGDDGTACSGTDQVNDTPNQAGSSSGCPAYPKTDACTATAPGVMFMNYMDYVYDECMNMFTAGQKLRITPLFATGGFRASLLNSMGCIPVSPCAGMPTAGSIAANSDTLCTGSKTLTLVGTTSAPGITYLWQQATSSNGLFLSATGTNTLSSYQANAISGTMYYRCIVRCGNSNLSDTTNTIQVNTYGVSSVSGGAICNAGNVTLTANGVGNINWYNNATATTPIFTGNPYTTSVVANTTFYANVGSSTKYAVGPVDYNFSTPSTSTFLTGYGEIFTAFVSLTIDTVYAYPGGAGTIGVQLLDSATNAVISTYTQTVTALQTNTKVALPVNFTCNGGVKYKLYANGSTVPSLYRNTSGATHPYTIPNIISITRSSSTTTSPITTYRYFYDWKITSGCITAFTTVPVTIGAPNITVSNPGVLCFGDTTGINVLSNAVNPIFELNGSSNTTGQFNNLIAGIYTATVTSGAGCSATSVVTIQQPNVLQVTASATAATVGNCDGSATAIVTGGVAAYTFAWSNGSTTSGINNLCSGSYSVCVTDANNCINCVTAVITTPNAIVVTASSLVSCAGANNGSITAAINGGMMPFQFKLNSGAWISNNVFNNLSAGTYTITGQDANNTSNTTIIVVGTSQLSLTSTQVPTVVNTCVGKLTLNGSNGVAPYTYAVNGNSSTNNLFSNLCQGTYTICVTDANGCSVCSNSIVSTILPVNVNIGSTVQPCNGSSTGVINVNASNGTAPYQYSLNGSAYTSSGLFNALAIGVYTITTIDANSMTSSSVVSLNASANLNLNAGVTNNTCSGACNGSLNAVAANGVSNYSYSVNGGTIQTSGQFNNLCAGVYTVATTDANGCTTTTNVVVSEPTLLTTITNSAPISCNGLNDGSVNLVSTGGVPPYTYSFNGSAFTNVTAYPNLSLGSYTFSVMDANNCAITVVSNITQPQTLVLNASANSSSGSITSSANGGNIPYQYTLNGGAGQSNGMFNGLTAGSYTIVATDAKGCKVSTVLVLGAPESIDQLNLIQAIQVYPNPSNGTFTIKVNSLSQMGLLRTKVYDVLGQVIHAEIIEVQGNTAEKTIHLDHAKGIYLLEVQDEHNAKITLRIVVQ